MEMAGIENQQHPTRGSVGHIEVVRTDSTALSADPEEFPFDRDLMVLPLHCVKNLIERCHQALSRSKPICGRVLISIRDPDIHHARIVQLLADELAHSAACYAVINPESSDPFIGVAKSQVLRAMGVRETSWVEIQTKLMLPRPINPTLEINRLDSVSLDRSVRFKIDRMQIDPLCAWDKRQGHLQIRPQFVGISGTAWIAPCRLNPAGQTSFSALEPENIVTLPALD